MAARLGMVELIALLRQLTDAESQTEQVNGAYLFDDDHLQEILDQHRYDFFDVLLTPVPLMESGSRVTKRYNWPRYITHVERDATAGAFSVVDAAGNAASGYTVYYDAKYIEFDADTTGRTYYLRCRQYNVNRAAAEIWLLKANLRASLIRWKAGDNTLYEDQEYRHCMEQYRFFRSRGVGSVPLRRVDYEVVNHRDG